MNDHWKLVFVNGVTNVFNWKYLRDKRIPSNNQTKTETKKKMKIRNRFIMQENLHGESHALTMSHTLRVGTV